MVTLPEAPVKKLQNKLKQRKKKRSGRGGRKEKKTK